MSVISNDGTDMRYTIPDELEGQKGWENSNRKMAGYDTPLYGMDLVDSLKVFGVFISWEFDCDRTYLWSSDNMQFVIGYYALRVLKEHARSAWRLSSTGSPSPDRHGEGLLAQPTEN